MARLNSEQFLDMGLRLLAAIGPDGLTISALCRGLDVTKGSFYHHFDSLAHYIDALLAYWELDRNYRPIELSRRAPGSLEQVEALTDWAVSLPHETEAALRSWGASNPKVAEVQARVDAARVTRIRELIVLLGVAEEKALVLANMGICLLIGFQHQQRPLDPARLRPMFEEVNAVIYSQARAAATQPAHHERNAAR